ncbi:MAG TPA: alpha/beta fold hydrolase [Mariprofundaceae bacterium]|nr:alpha/beta fold hydrolase [Mariprofundaceae bacterium]
MDELVQPDFPDAPPVVLIHGWNGGEFTWPSPEELRKLENKLQRDIYFFTYRTSYLANRYPPLEVMEEELDRFLFKYPAVDVVAHSMGGLLLRQYLSHHPDHPVKRAVFLSTPHFGTNAAKLLTGLATISISAEGNIQAQEIQPGSDFLWQLNSLEGAELNGVETLNVFVGESGWLDGDLVVEPSSAYLPWGHNVQVKGDHHTLARRLPQFQFIIDFLRDGTLPAEEAAVPARRDAWLRFVPKVGGDPIPLRDSAVRRINAKGYVDRKGYSICCDERAGLYPTGVGTTIVAEDLQPGEFYEFLPSDGSGRVRVSMDAIRRDNRPVELRSIPVHASGITLPAAPVEAVQPAPVETQPRAPQAPLTPPQAP